MTCTILNPMATITYLILTITTWGCPLLSQLTNETVHVYQLTTDVHMMIIAHFTHEEMQA